jgi:hypothetical protein
MIGRSVLLAAVLACGALVADVDASPQEKVTICHATSSASNPFVTITISRNGWDGEGRNDHTLHAGDYEGACDVDPTPAPTPEPTPTPAVDYPGPVTPEPEPVFWLAGWTARAKEAPTINFTG